MEKESFFQNLVAKAKANFPGKKILVEDNLDITLEQEFTGINIQGVERSLDTAFARPFRVLAEEKRKVGRVNFLFYRDKNTDRHYILGTFCYTSYAKHHKRLILFPGILGRKFSWHSKTGTVTDEVILDHFTIEPDLNTWHYTAFKKGENKKHRFEDNKLVEIKPGLYYWFGLSLNEISKLEPLRQKYSMSFRASSIDVDSIQEKLMEARRNSVEHTVEQVSEEPDYTKEFVHFDFLLDTRKEKGLNPYAKACIVPSEDMLVPGTAGLTEQFPVKQYEIKIEDFEGSVIVLVSKHVGKLRQEIFVASI